MCRRSFLHTPRFFFNFGHTSPANALSRKCDLPMPQFPTSSKNDTTFQKALLHALLAMCPNAFARISPLGAVYMDGCSFAWPVSNGEEGTMLRKVSVAIEPGSLVGVVGFVGSGKSSFLSAILGDMPCVEGYLSVTVGFAFFRERMEQDEALLFLTFL